MTSMPRASAAAISATLVVPQSTVTMTVAPAAPAASTAASDRPWPSSSRRRDVRLDRDAEPAQGEGQDRQAGQPVGVEVAEDQDPLARGRAPSSGARAGGPRRAGGAGSWSAVERVGEPGAERRPRRRRRGATRSPATRSDRPSPAAGGRELGGTRRRVREGPAEARFDHVRQDATRALHRGFTGRAGAASGRRPADPRCRASRRGGRAAGRPRAASPRAAGSRRRSTSTSPR